MANADGYVFGGLVGLLGAFGGIVYVTSTYGADASSLVYLDYDEAVVDVSLCLANGGDVTPEAVEAAERWLATFTESSPEELRAAQEGDIRDIQIDQDYADYNPTAKVDCEAVQEIFALSDRHPDL